MRPELHKKLELFKNLNTDNAVEISVSDIVLTEKAHLEANPNCVTDIEDTDTPKDFMVVIREIQPKEGIPGKYSLVTGYRDYQLALRSGYDTIRAVIVPYRRNKFIYQYLPKYHMESLGSIKLDKITIPVSEFKTPPSTEKLSFVRNQFPDVPIAISIHNGQAFLKDGYARYLVAKEQNCSTIPFVFYSNKKCKPNYSDKSLENVACSTIT